MDDRVRAILLGAGRMGAHHLRVLRESPGFEVVAVVDPARPALERDLLGDIPLVELVEHVPSRSFDAAVIATPTSSHYEIAARLLAEKKSILVEKPLAATHAECELLVRLALDNRARLAVGHVERFNPAVSKLREVLQRGLIGTPLHFSVTRVGGHPGALSRNNDVVLNLAVHDLDVLRSLLGPLRVTRAICDSTLAEGVCNRAEISLVSLGGSSATVHVSWTPGKKLRTLAVTGTRAVCLVDYMRQSCTLVDIGSPEARAELPVRHVEPLRAELDQFRRLLLSGDPGELCLGGDASAAVLLAERGLRHAVCPRPSDDWV